MLKGKLLFQVDDQEFVLMPNSSINIPEGQFSNNSCNNNYHYLASFPGPTRPLAGFSILQQKKILYREPGDDGKNLTITNAYDIFLCRLHLLYKEHPAQQSRGLLLYTLHWECPSIVKPHETGTIIVHLSSHFCSLFVCVFIV